MGVDLTGLIQSETKKIFDFHGDLSLPKVNCSKLLDEKTLSSIIEAIKSAMIARSSEAKKILSDCDKEFTAKEVHGCLLSLK